MQLSLSLIRSAFVIVTPVLLTKPSNKYSVWINYCIDVSTRDAQFGGTKFSLRLVDERVALQYRYMHGACLSPCSRKTINCGAYALMSAGIYMPELGKYNFVHR